MSEFRVKWTRGEKSRHLVFGPEFGMDAMRKEVENIRHAGLDAVLQFNHPTMGWVDIDNGDHDDDLEGEAYLHQGG